MPIINIQSYLISKLLKIHACTMYRSEWDVPEKQSMKFRSGFGSVSMFGCTSWNWFFETILSPGQPMRLMLRLVRFLKHKEVIYLLQKNVSLFVLLLSIYFGKAA